MFLFESIPLYSGLVWIAILAGLIIFNEVTRYNKLTGILFFVVLPIILTIFVWPKTSGSGTGAQTANWFAWVKTYSALVGCYIGLGLRFNKKMQSKKWCLALAPAILALNILEAVVREFQVMGMQGVIDDMFFKGGPWNAMNGIAGIINMLALCGWCGIIISKDKHHDLVWPDMMWFWIIAYDLWNFAYVYNCVTDRAFYSAALLISCTIPAFTIKKGAWAQHRVHTLALYMMLMLTIPNFFVHGKYAVASTHSSTAYYTVSILALVFNVGVGIYQVRTIIKNKKNPLKDDLYTERKDYQAIRNENTQCI
ncbi:hypothetical protein KPL40_11685 [Clostridium gasigenes]|uniref:DUF5692 family protein n=1 Tax=Clostridium gasigenes TaxID=94869 RepID=UPI001C0E6837|nr:DUF5692 family protein [Clostridium gasigenes]MBU3133113.1 hypothetical protein [Clostridium gasigenes]